jgi:mono/diheme cytochrome c family protein
VTNRRTKLRHISRLSLGCSTAWLALACGGVEESPKQDEPVTIKPIDVVREKCTDNPSFAECKPEETVPIESGDKTPDKPKPLGAAELAKVAAQNVLEANCGGCHGSQLTQQGAKAGMNYIDDMVKLVANQKVVPLDSQASVIVRRMRDGSMPPSGGLRVTDADIQIVANFIDTPAYWPDIAQATCANDAVSFDQLYDKVSEDLRAQEDRDQPFIRYISLANRVTAGVCTNTTLDIERQGLTKMMNMLSVETKIAKPEVVDKAQTLYRIDLRDFGWNRPITVDGRTFDDVWEAIIDANTYAVPFTGQSADDARTDAATDVPVMFLDSMLDVAAVGNLYYAIIGVDVTQSIDTFILDGLGIDVAADLEQEDLIRAGTSKSRVSRQDRLIEGHDIKVRQGVFYQSFDFDSGQNESIFTDPFGFNEGGREAIFTLPNGMLAYLIADEAGNLAEDSNILFDTKQGNYRALTSVSCSDCHVTGFIPVADEVRQVVLDNATALITAGTLNRDQLEQLSAVYLEPDAFTQRLADDTQAFYDTALARAALPLRGREPVSSVFLRFDLRMTLADAAGDLGLSASKLQDALNLLDPALGVLKKGSLDRDDFTAVYVASLCRLSEVLANQPEEAVCNAAAAALAQ